jgi:ADP-ribose pyrophosphatase YjhB (NUDIX family)
VAKRPRVSSLIIKDGKVLLVRDKGKHDYSLPGGGIKRNENTLVAGIRELYEETKLNTVLAERLRYCDFEGQRANHKVCYLLVEGDIHLDHKELDKYIWWDMESDIPVQGHVTKILAEYKNRNTHLTD